MKYHGSCHCGNVAYDVEGEIDSAIECNCSICERKGSLLWFVPRAQFTLRTPESHETTYLFNKHAIEHRFCSTCGIHSYAVGTDSKGNKMAAINVRCLENIDLAKIPVKHYDGRSK
ncbi:MAG: GFA family protein [Rudaea sp.]